MNRRSSLRCLLLALVTAGLRAEETPPASAAPAPDALSAARQDYEGINRTHSSPELQRLEGPAPTTSNPNVSVGEPGASTGGSISATGRAAKPAKSANWLVDAMTEQKPSPLEELKSDASLGTHNAATNLPAAKPADGAVNPLTSYMAEWMTPHDLELLKAKEGDGKVAMMGDKPMAAERPTDNFLRGDPAPGTGTPAFGGLPSDSRFNPYLTDLTPGLGESPRSPLVAPVSAPAAAPLPLVPVDLAPVKNPGVPADVLKAQDDAKYFPQLKRF